MSADPARPPDDDPMVQLNVRIPKSLRTAIDERVTEKDMTLGRWVANAARFALSQHGVTVTPAGATADPPHTRTGVNL